MKKSHKFTSSLLAAILSGAFVCEQVHQSLESKLDMSSFLAQGGEELFLCVLILALLLIGLVRLIDGHVTTVYCYIWSAIMASLLVASSFGLLNPKHRSFQRVPDSETAARE
jgi:hypothetical protein